VETVLELLERADGERLAAALAKLDGDPDGALGEPAAESAVEGASEGAWLRPREAVYALVGQTVVAGGLATWQLSWVGPSRLTPRNVTRASAVHAVQDLVDAAIGRGVARPHEVDRLRLHLLCSALTCARRWCSWPPRRPAVVHDHDLAIDPAAGADPDPAAGTDLVVSRADGRAAGGQSAAPHGRGRAGRHPGLHCPLPRHHRPGLPAGERPGLVHQDPRRGTPLPPRRRQSRRQGRRHVVPGSLAARLTGPSR
jgi:hypothetical protein